MIEQDMDLLLWKSLIQTAKVSKRLDEMKEDAEADFELAVSQSDDPAVREAHTRLVSVMDFMEMMESGGDE